MTVHQRARTLPKRVLESIRRMALWAPEQSVLVAVSGGLDSTALLHLLHELQPAHKGVLEVATVDHGLREESVSEVAVVQQMAAGLGLHCHVIKLGLALGPNLGLRAREARRAALIALGHTRIATGHHQDDQAETVLQHLLRGAGMTGLSGMRPLADPFCRPLLAEPRAVLSAWAQDRGLSWVEDPSNAASQRGEIRRLMPQLDALHGGAAATLARSARLLAQEDSLLTELVDAAWSTVATGQGLGRAALAAQHPAIQLRLLKRLIASVPARVGAEPLEAVVDGALMHAGRLDLAEGWVLACVDGALVVSPPQA